METTAMLEMAPPGRRLRRAAGMAAAAFAAGFGASATAGNFDWQVNVGGAHSDNIGRVAENETEENIANAGVRFSFDEQTRKLKTDLVGSFDYQKFLDDTFDDDLVGNFVGNLDISFIPERLTWSITDNFGQVLTDPLLPATPLNSENINFFATGPDLTFGFGTQNRLKLAARYQMTDYEDSPFDSTTTMGEIGFARNMSSVNTLSLFARLQQVDFDTAVFGSDYDQTDAFLRYEANGARTSIRADLGYTELQRDVGEDSSGELLRLDAARQLSPASRLSLIAGREFMNSGSAFAALQGSGTISLDPTVGRQTPEPFLRSHAALDWAFQRRATTITLRYGYEDQDYEITDLLDQTFTSLGGSYRRDLSAVTNITVDAARYQGEFDIGGSEYTDTIAGVSFNWGVTRTMTVSLSYRRADRDGDEVTGDYTENRVLLSIGFGRGTPRAAVLQQEFAGANRPD